MLKKVMRESQRKFLTNDYIKILKLSTLKNYFLKKAHRGFPGNSQGRYCPCFLARNAETWEPESKQMMKEMRELEKGNLKAWVWSVDLTLAVHMWNWIEISRVKIQINTAVHWILLCFLDLQMSTFHQIWEVFYHYFF